MALSPLSAAPPPALQISAESAPAGGWAQIKIYAVKPAPIASGHLIVNLDATVFGSGAMVGLFGANADASGVATMTGTQIDVQFTSPTGGIAQLAGLPVIVISVPVLASAAGRTVVVSATSPDTSLSIASGSVTVKGTLSVRKIPAGLGVAPAGTVVPVYGNGFTQSTTLTIDGVILASTSFVSAQEIDLTLGGAAELVGKLVRVIEGGVEFDYFCFQPNDPVNFPESTRFGTAVASVQPLFPLSAMTGVFGYNGESGGVIEVQNPNTSAASVTLSNLRTGSAVLTVSQETLSIPAGSWAIFDGMFATSFELSSDVPVRVRPIQFCIGPGLPVCLTSPFPYDQAAFTPPAPILTPDSLAFVYQRGNPILPAPRNVSVSPLGEGPLSVLIFLTGLTGSKDWLSISSTGSSFSITVNPSGLAIGTYQGSISLGQGPGQSALLSVSLTVTSAPVPVISAAPASLSFTAPAFNVPATPQTISLTSDSGPAPFSVTLQPGSWLKVSPMSGTTPATLTVTSDPAVTSQIYYQQRSTPDSILISGPGNALTIPATFNVTGVQTFQTFLGESGGGPNGLIFSAQTGSARQSQIINVDPAGAISATVDQPWLSVQATQTQTVSVTANPAGLSAGVYHGTVTISEPGLAPIAVPVTLGVWSTAPALTIGGKVFSLMQSFTFVQKVGEPAPAYQTAIVDSGGVPLPFTILQGATWLNVVDHYEAPAPTSILVGVSNAPTAPGEYDGSFTLQSAGGSIYVPVTLLVETGPVAPPVVSHAVSAASGIAGGVSAGEILTLRGYGVGAAAVGGLKLDATGAVLSKLNGLQVTFDGKAAPLLYTSAYQTNLIVPYEVYGRKSTVMQVVSETASGTLQTAAWVLPVVASAPAIFAVDATGAGQGAVVNQDGTINSPANPAVRGSVVSIYATGEGQTLPAGVTGSVTQSITRTPALPVTVTIGGAPATVQYAGSAPGEIAGLMQVNAVVPAGAPAGAAVAVSVSVGGVASQAGVTLAVK